MVRLIDDETDDADDIPGISPVLRELIVERMRVNAEEDAKAEAALTAWLTGGTGFVIGPNHPDWDPGP